MGWSVSGSTINIVVDLGQIYSSIIQQIVPGSSKVVGHFETSGDKPQLIGSVAEQQGNSSPPNSGTGNSGNGSKVLGSSHTGQIQLAQPHKVKILAYCVRKQGGGRAHNRTVDNVSTNSDVESIYEGDNDDLLVEDLKRENGIEDHSKSHVSETPTVDLESHVSETPTVDLQGSMIFEEEGEDCVGKQGDDNHHNTQVQASFGYSSKSSHGQVQGDGILLTPMAHDRQLIDTLTFGSLEADNRAQSMLDQACLKLVGTTGKENRFGTQVFSRRKNWNKELDNLKSGVNYESSGLKKGF